jgi:hypothetical protein
MTSRQLVASVLALVVSGLIPIAAQQANPGSISGRATDEARKPYADYTVQLRDTENGRVVGSIVLDTRGRYTFDGLDVSRRFIVELYNTKEREIVCTEGPFPLTPASNARREVNIDCGAAPAALWLLAASAGAVAAIAVVTESTSE